MTTLPPEFTRGRPDFAKVFDDAETNYMQVSNTLVFGCGPGGMVNQLWDESTKRNTSERRVKFHHETFEF